MRSPVRNANISDEAARRRRLGLIVNPIAGMGGPVGLKGTDGAAVLERALALGAAPLAAARAERALARLVPLREKLAVLAAPGAMGADLARGLGFVVREVGPRAERTTGADTRAAAAAIAAEGVELLAFAGGDGTARDVFDGAPEQAVLGIPTGVKMHSAVFATSPEAAGNVAALVLGGEAGRTQWRQAEVMDLDEDELRAGHVAARLYGYMRVPAERASMQNGKARGFAGDDGALEALSARIVAEMEEGTVYVLGCGTTIQRIKRRLGGEGTLLGVDVAVGRRLVATDVDDARLLRLTEKAPTRVIVGVTGGQGFVFGRGNQQISPKLLTRVGREGIMVVTGAGKLVGLDPPCLRVDTGDPAVDAMLAGYMRVHTAPGQTMMMRIAA